MTDTNLKVGDYVRVIRSPHDVSDEYIEAIATDERGRTFYCLSDGRFYAPHNIVKYAVQGEERRKLLAKLYEVANE